MTPDLTEKLWEVRSTAVIVTKTYVTARTREEAKANAYRHEWREVSSVSKLTANQALWGEN